MEFEGICINCFNATGGEDVCMNCGHLQSGEEVNIYNLPPFTKLNDDRYIVGKIINNGGSAVIYKAYDQKLGTVVAIKELLPIKNGIVTRMQDDLIVYPIDKKKSDEFD